MIHDQHPRQVPKPHLRELILAEDDEQTSFATSAVTDYHELLPDRCHPGQRQKCLKKIKITLHVKSETRNYETPCLDFHNRSVSPSCTMGKYIQSSERASLLVFHSFFPCSFCSAASLGQGRGQASTCCWGRLAGGQITASGGIKDRQPLRMSIYLNLPFYSIFLNNSQCWLVESSHKCLIP